MLSDTISNSIEYIFDSLSTLSWSDEYQNLIVFIPHSQVFKSIYCNAMSRIPFYLWFVQWSQHALPGVLMGAVKHQVANIASMLPHQFDKALK